MYFLRPIFARNLETPQVVGKTLFYKKCSKNSLMARTIASFASLGKTIELFTYNWNIQQRRMGNLVLENIFLVFSKFGSNYMKHDENNQSLTVKQSAHYSLLHKDKQCLEIIRWGMPVMAPHTV